MSASWDEETISRIGITSTSSKEAEPATSPVRGTSPDAPNSSGELGVAGCHGGTRGLVAAGGMRLYPPGDVECPLEPFKNAHG